MNVHNFWGYISNTLNIGDLLAWMFLSGWFFPDVLHVRVDSPNQACWSPCTSIARPKSASFTAAPLLLLASSRFSGWKKAKIGFPVKGWRWTRFCKKKHQRTTPIESPEFLCNENCFNWCMAFYQLLPKIFPADNLSQDLLLHFLFKLTKVFDMKFLLEF